MAKRTTKYLVTPIKRYNERAPYSDYNQRNNNPKNDRRSHLPLDKMNAGDSVNVIFANNEEDFNKQFNTMMTYLSMTAFITGIRLKKKKYFFPGHVHEYGITVTHDGFYEMED